VLFHPGGLAAWVGIDQAQKYTLFPVGLGLLAAVIFLQKLRLPSAAGRR